MAGKSIQFFGKEKVLQAYRARGIETWGLFDGKNFINAGDTDAELTTFLEMLEPAGSQSIYTLKVYNDIEDPDDLTDSTECNGSFNFKLTGASAGAAMPATVNGPRYAGFDPVMTKMQGIINDEVSTAIEKRFNGGGEEEKEEDWNDVIMGYVKEPTKLVSVINAIGNLLRPGSMPAYAAAGALGSIQNEADTEQQADYLNVRRVGSVKNQTAEQKQQRLIIALDKWEKADPDALEVIEKIVALAETDKGKYNLAKGFL